MTNAMISIADSGKRFAVTWSHVNPSPPSDALNIKLKISITPQIPTPNMTSVLFISASSC